MSAQPGKESAALVFLYRTVPGRMLLKLLIGRGLSQAAGRVLSSPISRPLISPFIRKNGIMYRVETPSLPIGILTDVEFTCTEDTLAPEDIIVIVSDGAVVCGEEWIERIILQWQDKSMQELAHLINDEATARRTDGHDDDITVLALRIKQAA